MPLNLDQRDNLADEIWTVLDSYEPPLTVDERNAINADVGRSLDLYTTEDEGGPPATLPIVDLPWPTATNLPRSPEQTGAAQFRFHVAQGEKPRHGKLTASPSGPAGAETFTYKWNQEPMANAEGGVQAASADFCVTLTDKDHKTILPGETWLVAVKCSTGGKFVGELAVFGY